jgi:Metallo-beta-lactamase superfamily
LASKKPLSDPPESDTIELSLFGPGRGESCLVHLGWNDWIIVDSCVDQRSGVIPALAYLERLGVEPRDCVKLVVASHAHDDHIAGIAEVINVCEQARFVCSVALTKEEFFALLEADEELAGVMRQSTYAEYWRINDTLQARAAGTRGQPAYQWAVADRPIYKRPADAVKREAVITALSPSDEAITRSLRAFAKLIPASGDQRCKLATRDPNTLALALWVQVGETSLLLGADLLKGPGANCGWNAVLSSSFRPTSRASAFKVPHHGAPNAHHPDVWTKMLTGNPVAILTPYRAGRTPRPSSDDRRRIVTLTDKAYISASPDRPSQPAAVRSTAARLSSVARNVREPYGTAGHVRARLLNGRTNWKIELVQPAQPLDKQGPRRRSR